MNATAQKPMTELPHAIPSFLKAGSIMMGAPAPNMARTKSLDARADAAYFGYAKDVSYRDDNTLPGNPYHPADTSGKERS
jgi:hypothetical protein